MFQEVKHAVLGAGHGGQVLAADLSLRGYAVNVYDHPKFHNVTIGPIQKQGGIYLSTEPYVGDAVKTGFAHFNKVTSNMKEAVEGVDIIHIVIPAFGHASFFKDLAPVLEEDQMIIIQPGYLGCLELFKMLNERQREDVIVAEANTMLYNARRKGPAHAWSFGIKKVLQVAAFPGKNSKKVARALGEALPFTQFLPARNVLETFLNNIAITFHQAPALLNTGWIETTRGNFRYYWDGATKSVTRVMEAIDSERMTIVQALGLDKISSVEWLKKMYSQYGAEGDNLRDVLLSCRNYEVGATPDNMKFTYLTQDVPYALIPMISIGNMLGIPTPHAKLIADLACLVNGVDYWKEARTMKKLGLSKLGKEQLIRYFDKGETSS